MRSSSRPWGKAVRFVALLLLLLAPVALIAVGAPSPAGAIPPAPQPLYSYYGPIRACTPHFAFDVRAGEAYVHSGQDHHVRIGRHTFAFGEPWYLDGPQHRDFVNPMGTLDVPGLGRLERVQLTARNGGGPYIAYLYDTGYRGPGHKVVIRFGPFDGSDRDIAWLQRLAVGERREQMCANVPDHLRTRPEREDPDAGAISQVRHPGPLTLCWQRLALDVRRGESVIPFWLGLGTQGVAIGNTRVTIGGSYQAPFEPGWRRVRGPLAAHPEFQVRADNAWPAAIPPVLPAPDGSEPRRVRLVRLAENPDRHPYGGVGFSFSGPTSEAGIRAFVRRLRLQTPRDSCFDPAP
jgi:hypothetical protein